MIVMMGTQFDAIVDSRYASGFALFHLAIIGCGAHTYPIGAGFETGLFRIMKAIE